MKLETGMYVKYKNFANISKIAKIIKIEISDNNCYENYYHFDNEDGTLEGFIIKASHNPIDLIEVGDFVNKKCCIDIEENILKEERITFIWEYLKKN